LFHHRAGHLLLDYVGDPRADVSRCAT
jgi:hypothetical protein